MRQAPAGGARRLFADMHPNLSWHDGMLRIEEMIGRHDVAASGRGLLLIPSVFAYNPVPAQPGGTAVAGLPHPRRGDPVGAVARG